MIKILFIFFLLLANFAYAEIVLRDNFEYTVTKTDASKQTAFIAAGWTAVKDEVGGSDPGGSGYIYTVSSIDGFNGNFPGSASTKVLMLESLPATFQMQTDFYLQFGDNTNSSLIPGDVWFQFWIYLQNYGTQVSGVVDAQQKFLYPCNGSYGCHTGHWIWHFGTTAYPTLGSDIGYQNGLRWHLQQPSGWTTISYDGNGQVGNNVNDVYVQPNKWYLVKIHFDTSTTNGTYQLWMREQGVAEFTQLANWVGGQDGFTMSTTTENLGGHGILKMPTTWGQSTCGSGGECYDAWVLLDDFVIAESESDLPTYTDGATNQTISGGVDLKGASLQ